MLEKLKCKIVKIVGPSVESCGTPFTELSNEQLFQLEIKNQIFLV